MDNHVNTNINRTRRARRWMRLFRPTLLLLTTTLLFVYISYAWIRREWTPSVEGSGITIATGGSLVFQFEGADGPNSSKNINEILGLNKNFVLKPVSNLNGNQDGFFALDLHKGKGAAMYKHLNLADYSDGSTMGIENGYIEFQMMLLSPESESNTLDRYVYLHNSSKISYSGGAEELRNAEQCIRVSITLEGSGRTWIFGADGVQEHTGVNPIPGTDGSSYMMDGVNFFREDGVTPADKVGDTNIVLSNSNISSLKEYNGGTYDETGKKLIEQDINKTLFRLNAGGSTTGSWITIRIWAEGTHEYCEDAFSGAKMDIKLQFSSYAISEE